MSSSPPPGEHAPPEAPSSEQQRPYEPVLTAAGLPGRVLKLEYAVRGKVVARSWDIERTLKEQPGSLPFEELVPANIGNPQAVGQPPITFSRQVLCCLTHPALLDHQPPLFPADVIARARRYLAAFPTFGAYSHSKGVPALRQDVAAWFTRRDGAAADPEDVILTDGASPAVRTVLELLIGSTSDGVLVPIPQYPLYSATITRLGGRVCGYYLDEAARWGLDLPELARALKEARAGGARVRALVVINPGNPTGSILSRQEMEQVLAFCEKERLVLLADEVYQDNAYTDAPFVSFRRVACELKSSVELFSFHSSSKGVTGECGVRGGLLHAHNVHCDVVEQLYKLFSISLCANTLGQAMIASILTPPLPGEPSHERWASERQGIFDSLKRKARLVFEKLNAMEGVSCQPVEGAMYAFPQITLPHAAVEEAAKQGQAADLFYCMQMLEHTGVIAVPGSGFGQRPGTWHYRITILPEEARLAKVLDEVHTFHDAFLKRFGGLKGSDTQQ